MATPYLVALGEQRNSTGASAPTLPVGWQPDDIFVLFAHTANQNFPTSPPTGWSAVPNPPAGLGTPGAAGAIKLHVFWRRAVAGDTDPSMGDSGNYQSARIVNIRGAIQSGDPWNVDAKLDQATPGTAVTYPAITTTVDECLVLLAVAGDYDPAAAAYDIFVSGIPSGVSASQLSSVTHRFDHSATSGTGGGYNVTTGEKAAAGAIDSASCTLTQSQAYSAWSGALMTGAPSTATLSLAVTFDALTLDSSVTVEDVAAPAGGGGGIYRPSKRDRQAFEDILTAEEPRYAKASITLGALTLSATAVVIEPRKIEVVLPALRVASRTTLGELRVSATGTVDWSGMIEEEDEDLLEWA